MATLRGTPMDDAAVGKRIDEIKHLLERIDRSAATRYNAERPSSVGGRVRRADLNGRGDLAPSPTDLLTAEYRGALAGESPSGFGAWVFVVTTTINTIVVATVAALVLGTVKPPGFGHPQAGSFPSPPFAEATGAAVQTIELAQIGTPDAPLRFQAGKRARLPIQIIRGTPVAGNFFVLSGLPSSAALGGATRIGKDMWLLPFSEGADVDVVVPKRTDGVVQFRVQLRQANGAAAAQSEGWLIIDEPAVNTAAAEPGATEMAEVMARSGRLLASGDIVAARTLYERAAETGNADAALALGVTYDPNRLWLLGTIGVAGNKERARQWYLRAEELGHPDASTRLNALAN